MQRPGATATASGRVDRLLAEVGAGSRRALGRGLSRLDGGDTELVAATLRLSRRHAWVIGVTGAPGAGKSTTVGRLIEAARRDGRRIAVLAVDPTSVRSGGALLGDRVRMAAALDGDPDVHMRSMANHQHLGGLNRSCPAAINLLAHAGFDTILLESVGVGQSEVEIMRVVDTVLVVLGPSAGDWVQAEKGGIMEIGDVFGIAKYDLDGAVRTYRDVRAAVAARPGADRTIPVVPYSAHDGTGIDELWKRLRERGVTGRRTSDGASVRLLAHDAVDAALDHATDAELASLLATTSPQQLLRRLACRQGAMAAADRSAAEGTEGAS